MCSLSGTRLERRSVWTNLSRSTLAVRSNVTASGSWDSVYDHMALELLSAANGVHDCPQNQPGQPRLCRGDTLHMHAQPASDGGLSRASSTLGRGDRARASGNRLVQRRVALSIRRPVMACVTRSKPAGFRSAIQVELLFMIGDLHPVTKTIRSSSFRNFVPKRTFSGYCW